ncbi:hypothetical protein GALMADRAFT_108906 [Galerina marginata CBS 339.88]|uniref:Uncharacterized protein n=1 Tax=Galerina marginata (strain CBS 339.88) TaxID=685588 RepID=A0A067TTF2_GALM3|nr:hypothetical protein GALMADRAFT_108906 [Galerina marginata CBS 339.88]
MQDHRLLPPEIWLQIFEWATHNINLPSDESTPFQLIPDNRRDPNLQVRVALSRVCRAWQTWAAQALYKDIKIRHGVHALEEVLAGREQSGKRYGELVHRVVLPYHSTVTGPSRTLKSVEILELCPHFHTLLRPQHSALDGLRFDYETVDISLPSLRRLEWWHHNEAERSGGINSLGAVLRSAPNLRYLFIGGVVGPSHICMEPGLVFLAKLQTLRLQIRSGLLLRQIISRWSLPSLTHLILDSPPVKEGLHELWEIFGHQLQTVEFGKHVRFLMTDNLSPCLKGCPNLRQLNYYFFFTTPPEATQAHANLSVVGLHSHVNSLLADGSSIWNLIEHHFEILCGPNLPLLKRIVLYGDWRLILCHPRFVPMHNKLRSCGRVLQLSDQSHVLT